MTDHAIALSPEAFALALVGPVRVKLSTRRVPPYLVFREDGGLKRWACFRASARPRSLSPVIGPAGGIGRVRSWAATEHPPLAVHTPKPRPKKKGANPDAAA